MDTYTLFAICALLGLGALLYTSVGHAGASAYIAIMALFSLAPATIRPAALVMNIMVASFTSWRFIRAGQFDGRRLLPFLLGSLPLAFLGGRITLPGTTYRPLIGIVLLIAGVRLLWPRPMKRQDEITSPPPAAGVASGAAIGLLSGLTGTGGGIFLSPLLIMAGWSSARMASGIAAVFILANSIAGLAGNLSSVGHLPPELPWFMVSVAIGAVIGTSLGVTLLPAQPLLQALGVVLLVAAGKLILT